MKEKSKDNPRAYDILQHKTFFGGEVKALPYVTAQIVCRKWEGRAPARPR